MCDAGIRDCYAPETEILQLHEAFQVREAGVRDCIAATENERLQLREASCAVINVSVPSSESRGGWDLAASRQGFCMLAMQSSVP